jgi:RNA polymerase sigma-70 factor (ECF subfamily)
MPASREQKREEIERDARRLCQENDAAAAAAVAIRGYGPEILGFLAALHRSEQDADDVFSLFCERLFRGLPSFGWECSLRTWAYTLARNTSRNFQRDARLRARRASPLSERSDLSRIEQEVRTETRPYLRTEAKSKLLELRNSLPEDDRALLMLRLDKRLEWKDIARIIHDADSDDGPTPDDAVLKREAQRLRKQFQLLKDRLVEAGRRAGLLGDREP